MRAEKAFFVYLLASRLRGTLYIGVTSNLLKRIWEHKIKAVSGFTAKYSVDRLLGTKHIQPPKVRYAAKNS